MKLKRQTVVKDRDNKSELQHGGIKVQEKKSGLWILCNEFDGKRSEDNKLVENSKVPAS